MKTNIAEGVLIKRINRSIAHDGWSTAQDAAPYVVELVAAVEVFGLGMGRPSQTLKGAVQ